jgi:DNA-3-methyladenine glycosylase
MRSARPRVRNDRDLCNGPAKLTQALGITGTHNGIDLVSGRDGFTILDDGVAPPSSPVCSVRIGISKAADIPWRWYVPGNVNVSR